MYCLTDFVDYASLQEPLKHSSRIKYTCFDVSENLIVLGSSAGSLYIFNETGKFLHLIPNGNGAVTKVQISPNEKYVAFSQRSIVCLYVINLSAHATPQVIVTHLKSNQQVTYLRWTKDCKHFFCGDTFGQVNLVMLSSFIGSNLLLNMTVHPLLFLESPIVQLDDFETLLLVSTQNKCILCNTDYEEYKQIGNKPRTGAFGACFWISNDETARPSRIYCARPGTRFWETDFEGDVIRTHQFKTALATAPAKIHKTQTDEEDNLSKYEENDELLDYAPQNLQFEKIQMLDQGFLLSFTELGLYIFDMVSSNVVLWCNQFERINDCKVIGDKIAIFSQTGSLYSVRLQTTDSLACSLVVQDRMLESACLMRKNVKYFADRAREDYDLRVLNRIKNFLIDRQEYEILNDLSVIFDAIAQCEGNGDNQSSGGSSTTAERSISAPLSLPIVANPKSSTSSGVYVLENAFCDNSKQQRNSERHLKDALLTVTGKFGKNIIKYKFNIFAEEQQKLVEELLPTNERSMPFKEINTLQVTEEEIVCRSSSSRKTTPAINPTNTSADFESHISAEEKTIYNLYLICKSSQIGNTKFVERYRNLFDEYTARELIDLLYKLEKLMVEHGDSSDKARKYCFEMYFNYLDPELIWEVDDETRDYITEGFVAINSKEDIERCEHCYFPLRFDNSCLFYELGTVLLRYFWSRNEQVKCFDILTEVPALFDVLAKLYMVEGNLKKVLPIIISYGKPELLQDLSKNFNLSAWMQLFELFKDVNLGRLPCVNCENVATVDNINRHFFYTWNCFLDIALENLSADEILNLIYKWSSYIPNDALDREFYIKCLLK